MKITNGNLVFSNFWTLSQPFSIASILKIRAGRISSLFLERKLSNRTPNLLHQSKSSFTSSKARDFPRHKHPLGHLQQIPTIFALSTSPGKAAIAIIRISGPASITVGHVKAKQILTE